MAIDPSIALNANAPAPIDFGAAIQRGMTLRNLSLQPEVIAQQIAASKAQQAQTEAATPGVAADSAMKQNDAAAQQFMKDNATTFTQKMADGTPVLDAAGNPVVDQPALITGLANKGYLPQAFNTFGKFASNQAQQIKNADDFTTATTRNAGILATLLENTPPEKRQQVTAMAAAQGNSMLQGYGNASVALLGDHSDSALAAAKKAGIDPATQTSQQLTTNQQNVSFANEYADAPSKDADSTVSKNVRDQLQAKYPGMDLSKQSAFDMSRIPGAMDFLRQQNAATINTAPARIEQGTAANNAAAALTTNNAGIAAANTLTADGTGNILSTKISALKDKAGGGKNIVQLQAAIAGYNSRNPGNPVPTDSDVKGALAVLQNEKTNLGRSFTQNKATSGQAVISDGTTPGTGSAATVRMVRPDGQAGSVPAAKVQAALNAGWKLE